MYRRLLPVALPLGLVAAAALMPRPAARAQTPPQKIAPEVAEFFENRVRPVLASACYGCHGKESQQGNLRLDQPISVAMASRVIARMKGEGGKPTMPLGAAPLSAAKIADFEGWVKQGAPFPVGPPPIHGNLWALQPVKQPAPPKVKNAAWVQNPIDAFILAKLEAKGLKPAPAADRRTLLRRLSYDLTGLPPTPAEVEAFLADKDPKAYEKQVDRILASPRYGERMARMWMDIARYADTKGYVFTDDRNYYHAYTYRDWLISSFNNDMPYDRFLMYQLAADRMETGEDRQHLAALGYLTLGRRFINNIHDILDDRIDVAMRGMQGMTVGCARCHDHKFDPISAKDYYGLYAIFASSEEYQPAISPVSIREPYERHDGQFQGAKNEREELIRSEVRRLRGLVKDGTASPALQKTLQAFRENEQPNDQQRGELLPSFEPAKRDRLAELDKRLDELKRTYPPAPEFAHALREGAPRPGVVFKRGNPGNPGDPAPRRFLMCVSGTDQKEFASGGRLELAQSIADPKNPLTSRVIANRIWLMHFGFGIVRTPSDFGRQGEKPSHPELLDWLASTVTGEDGWSIKKLHRRIVLSNTYKQVSDVTPAGAIADPENRLLAHQNRRRLDLEQTRDSLLMAAGNLDTSKVGGKSEELWETGKWTRRRTVYGFVERQNLPLTFKTFDFATPDVSTPQRFQTTVPQQSLFVMNSPLAAEQARSLAALPEVKDAAGDAGKIRALYRRLFDRYPTAEEGALGRAYLAAPDGPAFSAGPPDWQYGYGRIDDATGKVAAFAKLPAFVENAWRGGAAMPDPALGWSILNADGGHPGDDAHAVIRRWTAPADMTVSVSGKLVHPSEKGNGVRARVVSSRLGTVGDWTAQKGEARTEVAAVEVRKGETLDFVVDSRGDVSFDGFQWAPRVKQGGRVWDARVQFAGPAALPSAPLTRLERYAQALLMSNEFFFVD